MDLLERDAPLSRLATRLQALSAGGAGGCVLVGGEAGIGKTSLLRAAQARSPAGVDWLWSACEPLLAPAPLAPLIDLLDHLPPEVADAVRHAGGMPAVLAGMFAWLARLYRPLVLVIDDVHWADSATLDLLRYLSRRIASTHALLVLTFRDETVAAPLRQVLAGMPAGTTLRLELQPLSRGAVGLLARDAGRDPQQVFEASGGNPFFVSELLAAGAGPVPASVRDAVLGRVALLPPAAREVMELLSVLPSALAAVALERLLPGALAALRDGDGTGLIAIDADGVAFRHEIARQAVESALPPERARMLHRRVFEHLSSAGASAAHRVHHAERAGLADEVLRLAPEAAREAADASAHHQAAALYALALTHAAGLPAAQRATLIEAHASECMLTNQIEPAIAARQQALALRRELDDRRGQGINLRMLARLEWLQRGPASAVPYALQALPLLQQDGDERELAMACATLAQLQLLGPSSRPALEWGLRALRLAEQTGDPEALAFTLNTVACAELRSRDDAAAWARLDRSLALALAHGLEEHAARAYANLPSLGLVQRRLAATLRWCDEGIAYCEARDLDMYVVRLRIRRAYAWLELGTWSAAAAEIAALRLHPGSPALEREQARHVRLLLALRRGEDRTEADDDVAAYWRALVDGTQRLSVDPWYSPQSTARAEACWLRGDVDALVQIANAALPAAIEADEPWRTGQLACWLARAGALPPGFSARVAAPCAAELAGDFAGAAAAWAALGCRYEQALALAGGGVAELQQALALLQALGALPAARVVRARLRALGVRAGTRGPYRGARTDPLRLTPRERAVLELLREGLSNRAIALRLHRSERTVESHVSALLAKLGVATRAEAAQHAGGEISVPAATKTRTGH